MLIPGTRSYFDPISQTEEIWLEGNQLGKDRVWIRCRVISTIEQIGGAHFVPVEVQRCTQTIRHGILKKINTLFSHAEAPMGYHIPTADGHLSHEIATPVGERRKNMILAWGGTETHEIPEMHLVSKHGSISLLERQEQKASIPSEPAAVGLPITEQSVTGEADDSLVQNLEDLPPSKRIEVIEDGLEKFEELLLLKIQQFNIQRPGLPIAIQNPFLFVRENRKNPFKHYADAAREASRQGLSVPAMLLAMREPFYFSYAFKEDISRNDGVMGFAPLLRTVVMNAYRAPEHAFDNLVFIHEMVHCMHAAKQRQRDLNSYLKFIAPHGRKKVVVQEEFDAYAVELEAMNLVLDNSVWLAAQRGAALNPEQVCSWLQAGPERLMPIIALCRMALLYFRSSSIENYSPEYLQFVANMTAFDGYDLYSPGYQLLARGRETGNPTVQSSA